VQFKLNSYPTLHFFNNSDSDTPIQFKGNRDEEGILNFIRRVGLGEKIAPKVFSLLIMISERHGSSLLFLYGSLPFAFCARACDFSGLLSLFFLSALYVNIYLFFFLSFLPSFFLYFLIYAAVVLGG
jgi:hypothetical protein